MDVAIKDINTFSNRTSKPRVDDANFINFVFLFTLVNVQFFFLFPELFLFSLLCPFLPR